MFAPTTSKDSLLDRGFQVLLTAYPEAQRTLDYQALDLKKFAPGALSWFAGRLNELSIPGALPAAGVSSSFRFRHLF